MPKQFLDRVSLVTARTQLVGELFPLTRSSRSFPAHFDFPLTHSALKKVSGIANPACDAVQAVLVNVDPAAQLEHGEHTVSAVAEHAVREKYDALQLEQSAHTRSTPGAGGDTSHWLLEQTVAGVVILLDTGRGP